MPTESFTTEALPEESVPTPENCAPAHAISDMLRRVWNEPPETRISANIDRQLVWIGHSRSTRQLIEIQTLSQDKSSPSHHAFTMTIDGAISLAANLKADRYGRNEPIRYQGVYLIVNEHKQGMEARASGGHDRWLVNSGITTDETIARRRAFFVDLDTIRPSGVSATEAELKKTIRESQQVYDLLVSSIRASCPELTTPEEPLAVIMSGNGIQIWVRLQDIEEHEGLHSAINGVLSSLKILFGNSNAFEIDASVGDAKRLGPLAGTLKCKGANHCPSDKDGTPIDRETWRQHRPTLFASALPAPAGLKEDQLDRLAKHIDGLLTAEQRQQLPAPKGSKRSKYTTSNGQQSVLTTSTVAQGENPYAPAQELPTIDVLRSLDLVSADGEIICPSCGRSEDNKCYESGFKCFRESDGSPHFTNMGLVALHIFKTNDLRGSSSEAKATRKRVYDWLRERFPALPMLSKSRRVNEQREAFEAALAANPMYLTESIGRLDATSSDESLSALLRDIDVAPAAMAAEARMLLKKQTGIGLREQKRLVGSKVAGAEPEIRAAYCISDGRICRRRVVEDLEHLEPLANFTSRICRSVRVDDGNGNESAIWEIDGLLQDNTSLGTAKVPPKEFLQGNEWWAAYGPRAVIHAGRGIKDQFREAVQVLSPDVVEVRVYAHTGWRRIDDQWVYLHFGGAVGGSGITVELPSKYSSYALPEVPEAGRKAILSTTLKLMDVAKEHVALPLAAMSALPLVASILRPTFSAWLIGKTEAGKSVLAHLHQSRFGTFPAFPQNFESTPTSVERSMNTTKDSLLVVDDYCPKDTPRESERQRALAHSIIRSVGNGASRGRAKSTTEERTDFPPRGITICTAEESPVGPGGAASLGNRMLVINVEKGTVPSGHPKYDGDINWKVVTELQRRLPDLAASTRLYAEWIAPQYESLQKQLPSRRDEHLQRLRLIAQDRGLRMRQPTILADLLTAFELWLRHMVELEALAQSDAFDLLGRTEATLLDLASRQVEIDSNSRPEAAYKLTLEALLVSRNMTLSTTPKNMTKSDVGWVRDGHVFINASLTDAVILEQLRRAAVHVGTASETIHAAMADRGWVIRDGRNVKSKGPSPSGQRSRLYLKMPISAFGIDIASLLETADDDDCADLTGDDIASMCSPDEYECEGESISGVDADYDRVVEMKRDAMN